MPFGRRDACRALSQDGCATPCAKTI